MIERVARALDPVAFKADGSADDSGSHGSRRSLARALARRALHETRACIEERWGNRHPGALAIGAALADAERVSVGVDERDTAYLAGCSCPFPDGYAP
jgi:hypothetical protein